MNGVKTLENCRLLGLFSEHTHKLRIIFGHWSVVSVLIIFFFLVWISLLRSAVNSVESISLFLFFFSSLFFSFFGLESVSTPPLLGVLVLALGSFLSGSFLNSSSDRIQVLDWCLMTLLQRLTCFNMFKTKSLGVLEICLLIPLVKGVSQKLHLFPHVLPKGHSK